LGSDHVRVVHSYLVIAAILFSLLVLPCCASAVSEKSILVLASFHRGDTWTDQITSGIEGSLEGQNIPVKVYYEYMDANRIRELGYTQKLYELYRLKFADNRFDAVICADEDAYRFALRRHRDLFLDTPVIFCGITEQDLPLLENQSRITGVVENLDIVGTLDAAMAMQPGVNQVVAVTDKTESGFAQRRALEAVIPQYVGRLDFRIIDNLSAPALRNELSQLSSGTIVLFLSLNEDANGTVFDSQEGLAIVTESSRVPVYSLWDAYLGKGIIGGSLINGTEQGRLAGALALQVILGRDVVFVPVLRPLDSRPMFDYAQIERYGIPESALPEGSSVINRPLPVYSVPRYIVWAVAAGTAGLAGIVVVLALNISRRKQAEAKLRESEEKFRGIAQRSFEMIFIAERDGRILYTSPAVERITGYYPDEIMGMNFGTITKGSEAQKMEQALSRVAKGESIDDLEFGICRKDGSPAVIELNVSPIFTNGSVTLIQGAARDITERKQVEELKREAFEQIEKNIEQFAILGDQIRNPLAVIVGLADLHGDATSKKIIERAKDIDAIIDQLDRGWIESEKVREYLRRQYRKES
jgi:PAS domain S-box-containing protein